MDETRWTKRIFISNSHC